MRVWFSCHVAHLKESEKIRRKKFLLSEQNLKTVFRFNSDFSSQRRFSELSELVTMRWEAFLTI